MLKEEFIEKIDCNNRKALSIVNLAISPLEEGEQIDVITILESIKDYLKSNDVIFAENM